MNTVEAIDEKVIGGILPHHLYVGPEMARYFSALEWQNPSVRRADWDPIILIMDEERFKTTPHSYSTPYGLLEIDTHPPRKTHKEKPHQH